MVSANAHNVKGSKRADFDDTAKGVAYGDKLADFGRCFHGGGFFVSFGLLPTLSAHLT